MSWPPPMFINVNRNLSISLINLKASFVTISVTAGFRSAADGSSHRRLHTSMRLKTLMIIYNFMHIVMDLIKTLKQRLYLTVFL